MKKKSVLFIVAIFIISCSPIKKINIPIQKTEEYKSLNLYQQDFLYLTTLLEENYPHFEEEINQELYNNEKKALQDKLKDVKDISAFKFELQKFLALFKNNHTRIGMNANDAQLFNKDSVYLPIQFHNYRDKWYVVNIDKGVDNSILKSYIVSINKIKIEAIENTASQYISAENKYALKQEIVNYNLLQKPSFLILSGVQYSKYFDIECVDEKGELKTYSIKLKNTKQIKWLKKEKIHPITHYRDDYGYYYQVMADSNIAYLQINTFFDRQTLLKTIKNQSNIFIYPLIKLIVKRQYKKRKYGSKGMINEIKQNTESYPEFLSEMFDTINKTNVDNLIIDLRNNHGGNSIFYCLFNHLELDSTFTDYVSETKLTPYLSKKYKNGLKSLKKPYKNKFHKKLQVNDVIHESFYCKDEKCIKNNYFDDLPNYLYESDKKYNGKIYVLTSAQSISAASNFPVLLKDNNLAEIVGVPPANRPTGPTSMDIVMLPNTELSVMFSISFYSRPDSSKNNEQMLSIDKLIENSPENIMNGKDPAFEWILKDIKSKNN